LTSWTTRRVLVVVIALTGVGAFLYPMTSEWFHARAQDATARAYAETVASLPPAQIRAQLAAAHAYNHDLPTDPTLAPFAANPDGSPVPAGPQAAAYDNVLDVGPDAMMGTLTVPDVGINLPIYHGTDPATLLRGVGHLFGTAVPVGGA